MNRPESEPRAASVAATPEPATDDFVLRAPTVALPKGGGAIRGIGEKFSANPATGTGSTAIDIPVSPSRGGFVPSLSLSYDSGAGNGPFGFGWSLSIPSITRKTELGLPRYVDAGDSDVFLLSGAEDLVPALNAANAREVDTTSAPGYEIERYRPRVEGLFARIERWTHIGTREVHWRTTTREDVTSRYGLTEASRIADPDPAAPGRVFSWLICDSRDDRGNAIEYEYKREDAAGVRLDRAHEANRRPWQRQANLYLKRVRYGNTVSTLEPARWPTNRWLFELVLDYGEHDRDTPLPGGPGEWLVRHDPFSTYRAGFEVRTYRLCQRFLTFHHFPDEPQVGDNCLVRSLDLQYRSTRGLEVDLRRGNPTGSFLEALTEVGYRRRDPNGYVRRSMPPTEYLYAVATVSSRVEVVDAGSIANLPNGIDEADYRWVDLFGEGVSGVLTEQGTAWLYTRNLTPARAPGTVEFAPTETLIQRPTASVGQGRAALLDLEGDGRPDLVMFGGPTPGFFEVDDEESWLTYRPFSAPLALAFEDPNVRFLDLDGDGRADVLISQDHAFTFYPSRGEEGFAAAASAAKPLDEDAGPAIIFADDTQSIYLADMTGDGLTDLVRVRNGEISYWPNLGHGRFGRRVLMDGCPRFDHEDVFDQRRVRLADIDGSGTTDIIYLAEDGVRLYFNEVGNGWSAPRMLAATPLPHRLEAIGVVDLFGNGTACLVWSSQLPGSAGRQMRYVDLMGGHKPHLLTRVTNNLGAETRIEYASSAKFYVADRLAGRPWISRLPFPVHVVERIDTLDRVSGSRFITRFAYHHGHFDGVEREFRGFGLVEQWDTEEYGTLAAVAAGASNVDAASHVPPAWTKTWFHTGIFKGRDRVSNFHAGLIDGADRGSYYREPAWADDDVEAARHLLDDTVLPQTLTLDEQREACRALRGTMLRQELFARDDSAHADHPYKVIEQNFTVQVVQPRATNRHGVFLVHPREALEHHYERNPDDPRVIHNATLEVDRFGNTLRSAAVSYGRRAADMSILDAADRAEQTQLHVTVAEHAFTNAIDTVGAWRTPLGSEARTFELTGLPLPPGALRFTFDDLRQAAAGAGTIGYTDAPTPGLVEKRLLDATRIIYRRDNLSGPLPLHALQSRALPFERYKLVLTPSLVDDAFSGLVSDAMLQAAGYVHSAADVNWWMPSGQYFYSPGSTDSAAAELTYAQDHFFTALRYRDAFHATGWNTESLVRYDRYDLLIEEVVDPLGNRMTVGERDLDPTRPLVRRGNDYRVLQPALIMDANRNRSTVAYDALGLIVGTAVRGKPEEDLGDTLDGFVADFDEDLMLAHFADPLGVADPNVDPANALRRATTRMFYDAFAAMRSRADMVVQPAAVYTLTRETHDAEGVGTRIQHAFSYSDGFGRVVQQTGRAEPGPVPERDANGRIAVVNGRPTMTAADAPRRWIATGWKIFNNKGLAIRQFQPFFNDTHQFEPDVRIGVSSLRCYDPLGRTVAVLHPNHSWDKAVFDAWSRETWDANDTCAIVDPSADPHVGGYFARLPPASYMPVWSTDRLANAHGALERTAAEQALVHRATPTRIYLDSLVRPFLTIAHNRFMAPDAAVGDPPIEQRLRTRVVFSIDGNRLELIDARRRVVGRDVFDLLGARLRQSTIDGGTRWTLQDVVNKPVRRWDERGHAFSFEYDRLRRPVRLIVRGSDPARSDPRVLNRDAVVETTEYGEGAVDDVARNVRARLVRQRDGAGRVVLDRYDFKGNTVSITREVAEDYSGALDWANPVVMTPGGYRATTTFDALNRPTSLTAPDASVIRPHYNDASLLDRVDVNLRGATDAARQPVWTPFVTDVEYDAMGQRTLIAYGNGVETRYRYDPDTLRLRRLYTRRGAAFTGDCENPQPPPPDTIAAPLDPPPARFCGVQNLHYTYDAAGNITHIEDAAQHTVFFANQRVDASNDYVYDALYRLIAATGREHLGLGPPLPHSYNDAPRGRQAHPGDGGALGRYRESYEYDDVGNFTTLTHVGLAPGAPRWSRAFEYQEESAIDSTTLGNRLTRTLVNMGAPLPVPEPCRYDRHGNVTSMTHLRNAAWDYRDRLVSTERQATGAEDAEGRDRDGERTYYVYDAAGQRVRKVTELAGANAGAARVIKDDRLYLGIFEIYRRYGTNAVTRETLHVLDDARRIAQVETRTDTTVPQQLIRYVHSNHIESACLELDQDARVLSYEEYTPYGSTSHQAARGDVETPNRFRKSAMERDEETGFDYHGARYYIPWLGRWASADPLGIVATPNTYGYARQNPIHLVDPNGLADQPGVGEQIRRQVVVGTMLGLRQAWGTVNPLAAVSLSQVSQDQATVQTLLAQGDYDRAFAIASGFPDYFDIRREGVAIGATEGEQAAVALGHATGFNQAASVATGETRSGAELKGWDKVWTGVDATLRLANTVVTVATGVGWIKAEMKLGLPFSSERAMNKALLDEAKAPLTLPATSLKGPTMSDDALIARSEELFKQVVTAYFEAKGKKVPDDLGMMRGQVTVGVMEAEIGGKHVKLVAVNNPEFFDALKKVAGAGEEVIEPIHMTRLGKNDVELKTKGIDVHSEQVLAVEFDKRGGTSARVATSNKGCQDLCVCHLAEAYPEITHVNPSKPKTKQ